MARLEDIPDDDQLAVAVRLDTSDDGSRCTFQVFVDEDFAGEKCVLDEFIVTVEPWKVSVSGEHTDGGDIFWSTDVDDEAYEALVEDAGAIGAIVIELLESVDDAGALVS